MKNLPEFKALIERYESITIEEINKNSSEVWFDPEKIMEKLTGFGFRFTCTLCVAVDSDCRDCVYGKHPVSYSCVESDTYNAICDAFDPTELLTALRNRAAYMRTLI